MVLVVSVLVCIMSMAALVDVGFSSNRDGQSDSVWGVFGQSTEVEEVIGSGNNLGRFFDHSVSSVMSMEVGIKVSNVMCGPASSSL